MRDGTILFVHGTGVRLKPFQKTFVAVQKRAADAGITLPFVECQWGDALGIELPKLSLPGEPSDAERERALDAEMQWSYLDADPLFELRLLSVDPASTPPVFGQKPAHEVLWDRIVAYQPSLEMQALLDRAEGSAVWPAVWRRIVTAVPAARDAIYASGNETADAAMALARALVAELNRELVTQGLPALGSNLRESLVGRLRVDWGQQVFALRAKIKAFFTSPLRKRRRQWSERVSPELGDILLYQANGKAIRNFIRAKVAAATPPVYLLAHSLGGIACVDLLAMDDPPPVDGLITVGSQSPLLYEMGALTSLKRGAALPSSFPRWLNVYDQNDFLSYVGEKLFPGRVKDVEVVSGELPLAAHSAYWNSDTTWVNIRDFVKAPARQ
jgi:hypothetical protein